MEDVRKPLLIRIAPVLLLAYAVYTAAFLTVALSAGSDSSFKVGGATISQAAFVSVLMLRVVVYLALAWGFWREYNWSRAVMVGVGPAFLLLVLVLVPASDRLEIWTSLPQTAILSLAFYGYLYWKPNVREYWERSAMQFARQP